MTQLRENTMPELLNNAVNSIILGIEDYQSNDDKRPVSALRNFYAGVLLLGKACLCSAVPKSDPMEILAAKFVPTIGQDGKVLHQPDGNRTIDLQGLKRRFKQFHLRWPSANIDRMQELRNQFEHFHSPAPRESIQQAIADCFPLVQGFFEILKIDPLNSLGDAWQVMLDEKQFFSQQKKICNSSFEKLPWYVEVSQLEFVYCSACGSSLICQADRSNNDPASIEGKCLACGEAFSAEQTVEMIVESEYGGADHIAFQDGGESIINDCTECGQRAYVFDEEINKCYFCEASIFGTCGLCGEGLSVINQSVNDSNFCSYCGHKIEKVMRE